jgi:hypothetical protein
MHIKLRSALRGALFYGLTEWPASAAFEVASGVGRRGADELVGVSAGAVAVAVRDGVGSADALGPGVVEGLELCVGEAVALGDAVSLAVG